MLQEQLKSFIESTPEREDRYYTDLITILTKRSEENVVHFSLVSDDGALTIKNEEGQEFVLDDDGQLDSIIDFIDQNYCPNVMDGVLYNAVMADRRDAVQAYQHPFWDNAIVDLDKANLYRINLQLSVLYWVFSLDSHENIRYDNSSYYISNYNETDLFYWAHKFLTSKYPDFFVEDFHDSPFVVVEMKSSYLPGDYYRSKELALLHIMSSSYITIGYSHKHISLFYENVYNRLSYKEDISLNSEIPCHQSLSGSTYIDFIEFLVNENVLKKEEDQYITNYTVTESGDVVETDSFHDLSKVERPELPDEPPIDDDLPF